MCMLTCMWVLYIGDIDVDMGVYTYVLCVDVDGYVDMAACDDVDM